MVIGNGQLAKVFMGINLDGVCIFASGVSNSSCTDMNEFEREEKLLLKVLQENKEKRFVYFSSCALSAPEYPKNHYYKHKENMEKIVKKYSNSYYIFRIPQLFGDLILHKTLINFLYKCIQHEHSFNIYSEAYRYIIEINDVKVLVESYLKYSNESKIVDLANPYRYSVLDIVKVLEKFANKSAKYKIIEKSDQYKLDFREMNNFIEKNNIKVDFDKDYLDHKLSKIFANKNSNVINNLKL